MYLDSGLSGESESANTGVDCSIFRGIYDAVLSDYHQNGGDGAEAIRAGVTIGEAATAQAARNPEAARWGQSMEQYWKTFYTVPNLGIQTPKEQQIAQMLARIGRSPRRSNSTHQNYINDWQYFLVHIREKAGTAAKCYGL